MEDILKTGALSTDSAPVFHYCLIVSLALSTGSVFVIVASSYIVKLKNGVKVKAGLDYD